MRKPLFLWFCFSPFCEIKDIPFSQGACVCEDVAGSMASSCWVFRLLSGWVSFALVLCPAAGGGGGRKGGGGKY